MKFCWWAILPIALGCVNAKDDTAAVDAAPVSDLAVDITSPSARDTLVAPLPRFEQYPVQNVYQGQVAPVDLASHPDAQRFGTALRAGAATGPNFAGQFTVILWGCGSGCQQFVIVDAGTGRIMHWDGTLAMGASFRLDSELFIANPPDDWPPGRVGSATYYRWDGLRLVAIDSLAMGAAPRP